MNEELSDPIRFRPVWRPDPLSDPPKTRYAGRVLVLAADDMRSRAAAASTAENLAGLNFEPMVLVCRVDELTGDVDVPAAAGPPVGVIDVTALRATPAIVDLDLARWRQEVRLDLEALLLTLQRVLAVPEPALRYLVVAVPHTGRPGVVPPVHAGLAGLAHSVHAEYREIGVVHFATDAEHPHRLADEVTSELVDLIRQSDKPPLIDVAHVGDKRLRLSHVPAPPGLSGSAPRQPVVLLTGGGRGITAAVAKAWAATGPATLVLVGRTPLAPSAETATTPTIIDAAGLRAELVRDWPVDDGPRTPSAVEDRVRKILAQREVADTLTALRAAGADAEYIAADLVSDDAVSQLVTDIRGRHGRIDGLVHGAGTLEDCRLLDKRQDSLRRVVAAKADSAFLLLRHIPVAEMGFCCFFSSVAGRFGNAGQGDYASANTILDALAEHARSELGVPAVAIAWGPWSGGMAQEAQQNRFRDQGVQVIGLGAGARIALLECLAPATEAQLVIGDGPWRPPPTALFPGATGPDRRRLLDPDTDRFLSDHRINGVPVLPAAVAAELLAETAAASAGTRSGSTLEIRDFQLLKGVRLTNGPVEMLVQALPGDRWRLEDDTGTVHYVASVRITHTHVSIDSTFEAVDLPGPPPGIRSVVEALFHGPAMRAVVSVEGVGPAGILGVVRRSLPQQLTAQPGDGPWLLDPLLLDAAFQLALVWTRTQLGKWSLPSRFDLLVQGPIRSTDPEALCELRVRPDTSDQILRADVEVRERRTGAVLLRVEGAELVCSGLDQITAEGPS